MKDKLILKLKQNGFKLETAPSGVIVYSKELTRKHIIYTLKNTIFEKTVVQLTKDCGISKKLYKYSEIDDINIF